MKTFVHCTFLDERGEVDFGRDYRLVMSKSEIHPTLITTLANVGELKDHFIELNITLHVLFMYTNCKDGISM